MHIFAALIRRSIVRVHQAHDDAAMDMRQHGNLHALGYALRTEWAKRTAVKIDLPGHAGLADVVRGEKEDWLDDSTTLEADDRLIITAAKGADDDLDAMFAPND